MANPHDVELVLEAAAVAQRNSRERDARLMARDEPLDLSGADLANANLSDADFEGANLSNANLAGAHLWSANLSGADLRGAILDDAPLESAILAGAKLEGASLRHANLAFAIFRGAELSKAKLIDAELEGAHLELAYVDDADLSGANLVGANFSRARLTKANFTGAVCGKTIFASVDLSGCLGLETVHHRGPSSLGIDTLLAFRNEVPRAFLYGCGINEMMIGQLRSNILSMDRSQFDSYCILYSSADQKFARKLYRRLRHANLRVWLSPRDDEYGELGGTEQLRLREGEGQPAFWEWNSSDLRPKPKATAEPTSCDRRLLVLSAASIDTGWIGFWITRDQTGETVKGRKILFPIALIPPSDIQRWKCFTKGDRRDAAEVLRSHYQVYSFERWRDPDSFEDSITELLGALSGGEPSFASKPASLTDS